MLSLANLCFILYNALMPKKRPLTPNQKSSVVKLWRSGDYSSRAEIAALFGCDQSTIWRIIKAAEDDTANPPVLLPRPNSDRALQLKQQLPLG